MKLAQYSHIYFVGIGGIGMSALARYFNALGKNIAGYDKTPSTITENLGNEGIEVIYDEEVSVIPKSFLDNEAALVVYTPAVPNSHQQLVYFKEHEFKVVKRSVALGLVTENSICFAVAGTHGKTTTSTILAHLLYECNVPLTAFLGGISENFKSNYVSKGSEVSVVEADEFDRSFLTLSPDFACITSMDADHLDIYGAKESLEQAFEAFAQKLKPKGKLFVRKGLNLKGISYAVDESADYSIKNISIENGSYVFNVQTPNQLIKDVNFNLPGRHNLSNALIALAMAIEYGCAPNSLASALASFKGVHRRFSIIHKSDEKVYIDDYAHHPTEIEAVYQAVTEMYPNQKVLVFFQPHLFSRTKDFAEDFAQSLSKFDVVRLLEIYPARELPIPGITSDWLLSKVNAKDKKCITKATMTNEVQESDATVILTLGAGDIGNEVQQIKDYLSIAS
ncbi:MAG: UDP-N-acetylmuramate--L-alanine ligase [bacterium]